MSDTTRDLEDRRRGVRVDPEGLIGAQIAIRHSSSTTPMEVRDMSVVGLGLVGPRALPVALGERVYVLIDWRGTPRIGGAMIRATVRRRRPDRDGWFVGIEIDDLRCTPWAHLSDWIDAAAQRQPRDQDPS